jgi:hypothetical protein
VTTGARVVSGVAVATGDGVAVGAGVTVGSGVGCGVSIGPRSPGGGVRLKSVTSSLTGRVSSEPEYWPVAVAVSAGT